MKRFSILVSSIFLCLPITVFATHQQADTIGMKISRTYRTVQTTVFVEQSMDSIVSLDSLKGTNKLTTLTFDTLRGTETTEKIDTSYFITKPLKYWTLESRSEVTITQFYRENWKRGGLNSYSMLLRNLSSAIYSRGVSVWRTESDWRYGTHKQEGVPWIKNQDQINLLSRYSFKASPTWNYSAQFQFSSQISKNYTDANTKITYSSRFLSPARFTFSLGLEYVNTPNKNAPNWINLLLSPLTYRATYVLDTTLSRNFSVPANEHWSATFGPSAMLENKHKLTQDISLGSRLELFANILEMHEPFARVDWKVNFDIRLTRNLTFGFETWLIFDPTDLFNETTADGTIVKVRKTQFQQSLALRFVYRIDNN
jgi:hypothetical protein